VSNMVSLTHGGASACSATGSRHSFHRFSLTSALGQGASDTFLHKVRFGHQ
jgi:hypothetical protein